MRAEDLEGRFTTLFGRRPRRPGVYAGQPERADLSVESATPVQTGVYGETKTTRGMLRAVSSPHGAERGLWRPRPADGLVAASPLGRRLAWLSFLADDLVPPCDKHRGGQRRGRDSYNAGMSRS